MSLLRILWSPWWVRRAHYHEFLHAVHVVLWEQMESISTDERADSIWYIAHRAWYLYRHPEYHAHEGALVGVDWSRMP